MVTINKIEHGIAAYLDSELMPKLPNSGWERLISGTAISLFIKKSGTILMSYKDNQVVQMLGVMDTEGNVDVETLAEEIKKNMPSEGLKLEIPAIGVMTFRKDDVDKLYDYIMEA